MEYGLSYILCVYLITVLGVLWCLQAVMHVNKIQGCFAQELQ